MNETEGNSVLLMNLQISRIETPPSEYPEEMKDEPRKEVKDFKNVPLYIMNFV